MTFDLIVDRQTKTATFAFIGAFDIKDELKARGYKFGGNDETGTYHHTDKVWSKQISMMDQAACIAETMAIYNAHKDVEFKVNGQVANFTEFVNH